MADRIMMETMWIRYIGVRPFTDNLYRTGHWQPGQTRKVLTYFGRRLLRHPALFEESGGGEGGGGSYDDSVLRAKIQANTAALAGKVDKVTGKGLSSNDYTAAEKTKLAGLSNYDDTALKGRVAALEAAGSGSTEAKVFIAEYNVTTAQQIIAYLDSAKEPFAPMLIKRGNSYYTTTTAERQADNRVIIRSFATLSGDYYMFTYTVTNGVWAASSHGFQKLLESGTNIKTVNGQSLLGSGDIPLAYDDTALAARVSAAEAALNNKVDKVAGKGLSAQDYTVADYNKLQGLANIKSVGSGLALSAAGELTATGAAPVLAAALTATQTVGGVASGTAYPAGTTLESIIRAILAPAATPQPPTPSTNLPIFATVNDRNTLEEVAVDNSAGEFIINLAAQTETEPVYFDVPTAWNATVTVFNALTNQWQTTRMFDQSSVTHSINGTTVNYTRWTDNTETDAAATRARITWNV